MCPISNKAKESLEFFFSFVRRHQLLFSSHRRKQQLTLLSATQQYIAGKRKRLQCSVWCRRRPPSPVAATSRPRRVASKRLSLTRSLSLARWGLSWCLMPSPKKGSSSSRLLALVRTGHVATACSGFDFSPRRLSGSTLKESGSSRGKTLARMGPRGHAQFRRLRQSLGVNRPPGHCYLCYRARCPYFPSLS